ncbi:MAG: aminotransferase class IV [Bacteroidales bacterium]|nr:aminotransferase class IV [Bacteroidales bacterium]
MSRFIETIKINKGEALNIERHNFRMNQTRHHFFDDVSDLDLINYVADIPNLPGDKTLRCTFSYSKEIVNYKLVEYKIPHIKSLKIVADNTVDYSYKYTDRSKLNTLFEKRKNCDDIIIMKRGFFTDSLFANLVFYDGSKYFTPANPLLKGTKRSRLIDEGILFEEEIGVDDLVLFKFCGLINAMLDLEDCRIDIRNIRS